jgi:F-type H+-transporting ATPase subunit b
VLIDWFTVGAQALNFVILVWLMRRFLYGPILEAIEAREKRIAGELASAEAKKVDAERERGEFVQRNHDFEEQRAALWSKATDEANAERQRLLGEARRAADGLGARRKDALRSEARDLKTAVRRRARQEVFAVARKALQDLATTSLEEGMSEVFIRRLREMDPRGKAVLAEALKGASSGSAIVRSAFDPAVAQRAAIQRALDEAFPSAEVRVRFETVPELVAGIELTAQGQKIGWSIDGYLSSLEESVEEVLKEQDRPVAAAGASPPETSRTLPASGGPEKPQPASVQPAVVSP